MLTNCGWSDVLPRLLSVVDAENLTAVHFLRGGCVRLPFKDRASCDDLISSGLVCGDVQILVSVPCMFVICLPKFQMMMLKLFSSLRRSSFSPAQYLCQLSFTPQC